MGKLIKDFWTDETAPRRYLRSLLLAAGAVGAGCSQQLAAVWPGHQAGILATAAVAIVLAGMIGSKTGPQSVAVAVVGVPDKEKT